MCVGWSGTLLVSLCAEPRRTRTGSPHRQSGLARLGTLCRGERLQSVNEVQENSEAKSYGGLRNPNAAVAANPGLRLLGVWIPEVMEEMVCGLEFPRAPLGSPGHSWPSSMSQRSRQSEGTSRTFGAAYPPGHN